MIINIFGKEWNYSADILEKKVENEKEIRVFKSNKNNNVLISNDTISIFTKQAKQYTNSKELHLIGPVIMINGKDSLKCENMKFWYDIDSLEAFGKVNFKFNNNILITDSLTYMETNGFRGYSFKTSGNSSLVDPEYNIQANQIIYNDELQKMKLIKNAFVYSNNNGVKGDSIDLNYNIGRKFLKNRT